MVQVPPNEKYTKMIIASGKEREHQILNRPWRHTPSLSEEMPATTLDALFDTDNDAQTIVLCGVAGVGKTTMSRKIILDWASGGQIPGRFDSVFYLSCQQMNLIVGEANLADLVLNNDPELALRESINELLMNPGKCLFIVDGFEELSSSTEQREDNLNNDPCERKPVGLLLSSLFRKTLLPDSCLFITTRPNALEKLEDCLQSPCYVRHLGFSEEGKKEYFCKFFGEEELATWALNYLKRNEALLALSFVPTVCWIICTVMKQQHNRAEANLVLDSEKLTTVYALYFSHLAKSLCCSDPEQLNLMRRFCSFAADGIRKKKTLFKVEEIQKQTLGLVALHETLFRKDLDCEDFYSFIHPTVQEFLAALFYVFEDVSGGSETTKEDIKFFLDDCGKGQGDLSLTVQFIFGLLNKEMMKYLKEQFEWNISSRIKADLLEWFKVGKQIEFIYPNYDQLERFHSLYEIREEAFVKHALNHLTQLTFDRLTFTQIDQVVLCFCIKNCLHLETLSLYRCFFLSKECEAEVLPSQPYQQHQKTQKHPAIYQLCQTLKDPNCKIKKVELDGCQFKDRCWEELSAVLSTSPVLMELDLQMTSLKDSGVRLLCEGLIHPNCRLEKLGLRECDLTHDCGGDLSSVLRQSQSLKELKLGYNSSLGVQGVQVLCEGLKHPDCKLQNLELDECGLVAAGCQDLIPVLITSRTLRKLNLERNKLEDAGVKLLCQGLKHSQCQLQSLSLATCDLGPACCGDLSSVLTTSQTLTELILEYNKLEDSGVRLLCEGLKQPNCKLEKLELAECGITAASCGDLASVLTVNQSLKKLVIEYNKLGDSGVKLLCEGLKHPHCRLEILNLFTCDLTAACMEDLASFLSSSQTLTELLLGGNALGDSGLKQLCEGLKHPHCKIQKLCLCSSGITAAGCVELSSVFSTNQALQDIDLWDNALEDSGLRLLCEGLKHPDCKLEVLSMWTCKLTAASCGDLCGVLSTNQSLKKLKLENNKLGDSGVMLLCERLKHPNCRLESIGLDIEELSEDTVRELRRLRWVKPELIIDT